MPNLEVQTLVVAKRKRSDRRVARHDYSYLAKFGKENHTALINSQARAEKQSESAPPQIREVFADPPAARKADTAAAKQAPELPKAPTRQRRERVLSDPHSISKEPEPEPQNEYERQRAERIKRNEVFLEQLKLKQLAEEFRDSVQQGGAAVKLRPARPRKPKPEPAAPQLAIRKSCRQRGLSAGEAAPEQGQDSEREAPDGSNLMELPEYFRWKGVTVEGHTHSGSFQGWVKPELCQRYSIANTADEAWESNGGGKFTFKIDKQAIPAALKSRGWSDARAFSSTQLRKNPNAYFYRHVAPHEQQAQGEWTEEEHKFFMETAKQYGAGDKWGLFSSYIPQRVGYQCSAYYREVIIPQGLFFDPKFRMTKNGKAVYVG